MLEIKVRKAKEDERLNINVDGHFDGDTLPQGVVAYDSTGWCTYFLAGLAKGDWVVEISDPDGTLRWQEAGIFIVQAGYDGDGYVKAIVSS